jgi:hypothetical protein
MPIMHPTKGKEEGGENIMEGGKLVQGTLYTSMELS